MVHMFICWMYDLTKSFKLASIIYFIVYVIFSHVHLFPLLVITPIGLDYYVTSQDSTWSSVNFIFTYLEYVSVLKLNLPTFSFGSTFMKTLYLLVSEYHLEFKYLGLMINGFTWCALIWDVKMLIETFKLLSITFMSHLLPMSLLLS